MGVIKKLGDLWGKFGVILNSNQKKWGIILFFLSLLGAVAETLGVSIILPLVQVMVEPSDLLEYEIIAKICDVLQIKDTNMLLLLAAGGVVLIYIIKNVYLCFLSWIRVRYTTNVQRELSVKMFRSYMKRGYSFFRQTNSATLLRGTTESVAAVYIVILNLMKILAEILTIACIFAFILFTDWKLAISVVVLVGSCLFLILVVFRSIMKKAGELYFRSMGDVNRWSLQLFSGIKEVLVFNRKDFFVKNYEDSFLHVQRGRIRQTVATEIPAYIIEGACVTGIIVAVCIRVNDVADTASFIPQLAAFAMAAFRLLPSVGRITSNFNLCIFNMPAVTEVYENILEAKQYEEKNFLLESKGDSDIAVEGEKVVRFNESLVVDDVSWCYPDGGQNVLDHVSLTIKKGQSVAFVGPSGAGKSTLADIILGLFKPQEGAVLIDGKNVWDNKLELSKIISFVPQSVYLIDDTIRRNVAFGIADEEISDELVWNALAQAHIKEYVQSLPQGLDNLVGERGVRFSGGQSQRLAIARALYSNPDILVLDEATSSLDNETESAVMESIELLQGYKTLIIIAHRLSTIEKCDKIYEIVEGQAVEKKYDELIQ